MAESCGPTIDNSQAVYQMVQDGGVYVTIYNSIACSGDTTFVTGELQQFDSIQNGDNSVTLDGRISLIGATTDWTLSNADIVSGSIYITDVSGVSGYNENVDYTMNYDNGVITRLTTGMIQDLDTVKINYSFHLDCIDEKTGNPNRFCKTCKDPDQANVSTGIIYYNAHTVKGLFHIPTFNSPFDKNGVWKLGDGVLSFAINETIDATGIAGGIFLQDKVKIIGRPGIWRVMSAPQTIQLGQFLGIRCHLRKIEV
jgi:hypothetical protein